MKKIAAKLGLFILPNFFYVFIIMILDDINMIYHNVISKNSRLIPVLFMIGLLAIIILPYFLSTYLYSRIVGNNDVKCQLKKGLMCLFWIVNHFIIIFCFWWDADYFMACSVFFVLTVVPLAIKGIYHFVAYQRELR